MERDREAFQQEGFRPLQFRDHGLSCRSLEQAGEPERLSIIIALLAYVRTHLLLPVYITDLPRLGTQVLVAGSYR